MARLITTVSFEGISIYSEKSAAPIIAQWTNTTGRTVCVYVQVKLGKAGGSLASSAANFRIGLGTYNLALGTYLGALEPSQLKNGASITYALMRSFNTIEIINGDRLDVCLLSDNAGDTDVDGDVLLFDMMTGIDVRAVGSETPISIANINTECDTALTDYDPPTRAELTTDKNTIMTGGVVLASNGLDSISTTEPDGIAANFREMFIQVWRRLFGKSTLTKTELKCYRADGSTVATTQAVSADGATQTQGEAS